NNPAIYTELEKKGAYLEKGLGDIFRKNGIAHSLNRVGSMISLYFSDDIVIDFETASKADIAMFNKMFHHLLNAGIYLPPSAFESWFLSDALTYDDLDKTLAAFESFFNTQ
ncbi:MAG: aspartate aminotransferase family protein, partial [Ginsengibacter sp.]